MSLPAREDLRVPGSLAERWEVVIASQLPGCRPRALGAALGLCWPRYRRTHPYDWMVLGWGGQVLDRLLAEAKLSEVLALGEVALALVMDGLVPVEGVEASGGAEPSDHAGLGSEGASSPGSS